MLQNLSQIKINVKNKLFHFLIEHESTLDEVKEALFQAQKYIGNLEDQVKASQAPVTQSTDLPNADHSVETPQEVTPVPEQTTQGEACQQPTV